MRQPWRRQVSITGPILLSGTFIFGDTDLAGLLFAWVVIFRAEVAGRFFLRSPQYLPRLHRMYTEQQGFDLARIRSWGAQSNTEEVISV
jgi:hypothetical protein